MAYPEQLGGRRDLAGLQTALTQWARDFDLFLKHTQAIADAYSGVTAADFQGAGATAGQATALVNLVTGLAAVPTAPAIVSIGTAAKTVRDIGS